MILEHWSAAPLQLVESRQQVAPFSAHEKPAGLWCSVRGEFDWPTWCRDEDFRTDALAHCTRVDLVPGARLLVVDTVAAMDALQARYPGGHPRHPAHPASGWQTLCGIDWPAVARDWQGIAIAPYQWSERLNRFWYYGWDCASACIWDAAAVADLVPRKVHGSSPNQRT